MAAARALSVSAVAPEEVLLVSMPADWLDRLVGVLVDNACRHAHGAVRVEARAIEGGRAEFSVSDDGEGIPDAELPLLFHRFHRGTSVGEGAGLGSRHRRFGGAGHSGALAGHQSGWRRGTLRGGVAGGEEGELRPRRAPWAESGPPARVVTGSVRNLKVSRDRVASLPAGGADVRAG